MKVSYRCYLFLLSCLSFSIVNTDDKTTQEHQNPSHNELLRQIPFEQKHTTDKFGRTITYYLSRVSKIASEKAEGANKSPLPLVLVINGSGAQSVFMKRGDKVASQLQGLALSVTKGAARVAVVEKPGVRFLDELEHPGSALGATEEFLREHTLERWGEANLSAIRAIQTQSDIDRQRTLVMGHSEGGIVAAYVAAEMKGVSHVACLAHGGPTQLFSLAELAMAPQPNDQPGDATRRRQAIYDGWREVQQKPDSIADFWLGHPNRRWSSFLARSTASELLRSEAKIYLAHGTADTSDAPAGHEYTVATLRANGREFVEEFLEGMGHGFQPSGATANNGEGLMNLFQRITHWFLGGANR